MIFDLGCSSFTRTNNSIIHFRDFSHRATL